MNSQIGSLQTEDPRFPVGRFARPETIAAEDRIHAIAALAGLPSHLRSAVAGLDRQRLDTPYRDGGWTVRQLVHHIADSHINALVRVRMALTEDWPTILPYDEKAWAKMPDYTAPVEWSLDLLESLHARWVMLLRSLDGEQWARGFNHPANGPMTVEFATLLYAWHSRHHVAHITRLRERQGW
jgi:hypothetical protein